MYEYRGTLAHLNGVSTNPSHQSTCLFVYLLSLLGTTKENVTAKTNTQQ
jgi:hypothetical protein